MPVKNDKAWQKHYFRLIIVCSYILIHLSSAFPALPYQHLVQNHISFANMALLLINIIF